MGYYSDVPLCLSKAGAAKLATSIEARVGNTPEDFASCACFSLYSNDMGSGSVSLFRIQTAAHCGTNLASVIPRLFPAA